ncbi:HNH endonuclease [Halobacillus mangrovi]|uniref:HNH endonuclease n=1 Tax=Halobacillus mangrovi TaxID=402384 RepID=UPI003D950EA0
MPKYKEVIYGDLLFKAPIINGTPKLTSDMRRVLQDFSNGKENKNDYPKVMKQGRLVIKYETYLMNRNKVKNTKANKSWEMKGDYFIRGALLFSNDSPKKLIKDVGSTLRGFSFEELKKAYIDDVKKPLLEIKEIRNKKYIKVPLIKKTNDGDIVEYDSKEILNHIKKNKPNNNTKKVKEAQEQNSQTKNSKVNNVSQDALQREPIGSTIPYKRKEFYQTVKSKGMPLKKTSKITQVRRDQKPVAFLKEEYNNTCQICRERIEVGPNMYSSEVHHIRPLGGHSGQDSIDNMIVLCPNHHVMFDRGAITLDLENDKVIHFNPQHPLNTQTLFYKHKIDKKNIAYHNENIFLSR